jgi:ATP-dependent helicase IRC3
MLVYTPRNLLRARIKHAGISTLLNIYKRKCINSNHLLSSLRNVPNTIIVSRRIHQLHKNSNPEAIEIINEKDSIDCSTLSKIEENKITDEDNEYDSEDDEITSIDTSNPIALREYQQECIDTIYDTLAVQHAKRIAVSIATGGGKTVIFCMAIPKILEIPLADKKLNEISNGILILVHRRELATQTIKTIQKLGIIGEDRIFLDMGKDHLNHLKVFSDARPFIIVGSVPTLARNNCTRLAEYKIERFKAVIVDECHHAVSESYLKIFNKMKCSKKDEDGLFLLGFTATMARADRLPLRKVFDKIVFQKNISSLIKENHLCDFDWQRVELGLNLNDVEIKGGDFRLDSLSDHVNTEEINIIVLKTYLKMISEKPNNFKSLLVFCVSIQHMKDLSQLFRENGINAQYVSGETKSTERDNIVNDFKNGKIKVLFNCGVFTEGTDIPNIDSIFLLRPTKSKPLLIQMVGRGLRLCDGKEKLIVTDFVDNKSLGLTVTSTLNGKPEVISLLSGADRSGFNHRDALLPGEIEYLKFTNFKGLEMLDEANNTSKKSYPYILLKEMKRLNIKEKINFWTQVKFNAWAMSSGYKSYLKIEVDTQGRYKSLYCFTKVGFNNSVKQIHNTIVESDNFEEIVLKTETYIQDHEFIKNEVDSFKMRALSMQTQKITKTQSSFINNTVLEIVKKSQTYALDLDKFTIEFQKRLNGMSKWEASELIFAYTVSRSQAVMLWLRNTFFNSQDKRKKITKDEIIEMKNNIKNGTWF